MLNLSLTFISHDYIYYRVFTWEFVQKQHLPDIPMIRSEHQIAVILSELCKDWKYSATVAALKVQSVAKKQEEIL